MSLVSWFHQKKKDIAVSVEGELSIEEIESTDQFMRSMTGDKRWKWDACFADGAFATIVLPPDDPASYATMYALSKLGGCEKTQEEFDERCGAWSGRSKLFVSDSKGGYIQATGWLTPLVQRFPDDAKYLKRYFRDASIRENTEIRVIGDIDFMKRHYVELKNRYTTALAMAKANDLRATDIFVNKNTQLHYS